MPFNLRALIPEHIARVKPYASARNEFDGHREHFIFLDANELPQAIHGLPPYINRYPAQEPDRLKLKLAAIKNLDPNKVFLGSGSDEIIDLLMRCFARPGKDRIMIFPPTFGMYAVRAEVNNLGVQRVNLDENFMIQTRKALDEATADTRLMFVCHPNNPSANLQDAEQLIRLIRQFKGIVVVDEAYIDFSPANSMLPYLEQFPNLVVLQTFSKAYGLAGARVGVAYASADITAVLNKVRFPYNVGSASVRLAEQVLENYASFRLQTAHIVELRNWLSSALRELPCVQKIYPSDANFLLVKTSDANAVYRHLTRQGVVVRNRDKEPGCQGCLRVTIGTTAEMRRLVSAWKSIDNPPGKTGDKSATNITIQKRPGERQAVQRRKTSETDITLRINLDGMGYGNIHTGLAFFDHMLQQIARHGAFDLEIHAEGDLQVDPHHTIEDTGITLGETLIKALGDKKGIERYGFSLPMDDSSASVLIDLGGRSYLKWEVAFEASHVGGIPVSLFRHFFRSFAEAARCNVHIKASGEDDHHTIEAVFKAFAKTLRMALSRNDSGRIPSTKGVL